MPKACVEASNPLGWRRWRRRAWPAFEWRTSAMIASHTHARVHLKPRPGAISEMAATLHTLRTGLKGSKGQRLINRKLDPGGGLDQNQERSSGVPYTCWTGALYLTAPALPWSTSFQGSKPLQLLMCTVQGFTFLSRPAMPNTVKVSSEDLKSCYSCCAKCRSQARGSCACTAHRPARHAQATTVAPATLHSRRRAPEARVVPEIRRSGSPTNSSPPRCQACAQPLA